MNSINAAEEVPKYLKLFESRNFADANLRRQKANSFGMSALFSTFEQYFKLLDSRNFGTLGSRIDKVEVLFYLSGFCF